MRRGSFLLRRGHPSGAAVRVTRWPCGLGVERFRLVRRVSARRAFLVRWIPAFAGMTVQGTNPIQSDPNR